MPKNRAEVLFVSVLQVISTMVFMIYVGEFSNIIQYQSYRSFGFYSKYLELQEFLKNNRVSSNLVKLVNKYSLHLWRESRGVQVPHFLKAAPHCLRLRLMSAAFGHHLTNNSIFKNCEAAFLRQLVGCLRLYTYNKGMFVVRESEITDSMYLIHTGRVEESKDEDNQKKTFYTGECFGMLQGTTHELPYMHSYCTLTKCQILTLNLNDWEELLKHFPASKDTIYRNLYRDGSPPNPIKRKMDTKGKKVRKVAIINSYNEISSDHISDKATEPMITSPTEHKYTESEPIDNLEVVSSLPSEEFVSILISDPASTNLISEKIKLEQISGSPDNRSKLDKSNTPKEIDNQEISNKSSKGQDNTIPTMASIITLQGTKNTTFSNFTIISTGSTNADSLLQLEDEEITSDLIAKLDRVNKPTASTSNNYETSATDKQNLKEIKYAEADADEEISSYEMKTVEEYIFQRQEPDDSISLEQQQAKFSPEKKELDNLPTSSRANRYLYRVRYKDENSKDASPNESVTKEGPSDDTSSNKMKIMSTDSKTTDDPKEKNENTTSGNERKNMKQSKKKDD
ncbi:unnamed protein product [Parnassius mnemosyne]|uniref:Cyclic nucleotide-binding domain-containing protein n=1 Tax=Parnassius mnemosyne TaxID=213953 RepID=A0AAV1MAE0_9NEOP